MPKPIIRRIDIPDVLPVPTSDAWRLSAENQQAREELLGDAKRITDELQALGAIEKLGKRDSDRQAELRRDLADVRDGLREIWSSLDAEEESQDREVA